MPDKLDEDKLIASIDKYSASIKKGDRTDAEAFLKGTPMDKAFKNCVCRTTGFTGVWSFIAKVIANELNMQVSYWTQHDEWTDFEFDNNPDCILIPEEEYISIGEGYHKYAMDRIEPYARVLGIKVLTICYFQTVFDKEKDRYRKVGGSKE